ncbi:DUF4282 domain-containing protein [Actinomadura hibisca]|uniref:DUF4282 domain-containing protein n=1 Tax=Actinomadura hibisca TaxID=68565 RepID=UPI000AAB1752|nr:DUF4282 domain-containing protein [Actinomadura hibisca]
MSGPGRSRGLLSGLADLSFRQMVTPRLIGCLYVALMGCAVLGAVAGVLLVAGLAGWLGAGWLVFAPVVVAAGVVGVLAARVACEWTLMSFTRGRALRDQQGRQGPAAGPDGRWSEGGEQ